MKSGLTVRQLTEIVKIFANYNEIEEAVLFGSRAMGNYKKASDVDIVLFGENVINHIISSIQVDFEDSQIPYFFDVLNYKKITSDELKQHIEVYGKTIYKKTKV
jgi:predicted nucleotidyltransferase